MRGMTDRRTLRSTLRTFDLYFEDPKPTLALIRTFSINRCMSKSTLTGLAALFYRVRCSI
ncbi:hypothetical protein PROFUN_15556 [Planoprotostelium fungivorum]|uniref:Uncharacterized protein n=1 Tax=Planoprotostelium fungivorum TaxID=1890364 RepID=A0A2P6MVC9_9EUKA|nr:hypothetical protein PROFUN_15556 [Planoprotostelium fungivorum]